MSGRSWLRRWAAALVALAVLVPGAVLTAMSVHAFDYLGSQPQVRDVPRGTTATYAGARFRLLERRLVTASSSEGRREEVPPGTELVIATIRVDPSRAPKKGSGSCDADLVQPTPAGDRTWSADIGSTSYFPPSSMKPVCTLTRGAAYRYQAVFLVPAGAAATAELRVSSYRSEPEELRLR